jgi:hypothetical protein
MTEGKISKNTVHFNAPSAAIRELNAVHIGGTASRHHRQSPWRSN